jgi:predicted DNA binding CopG/RHH family protein
MNNKEPKTAAVPLRKPGVAEFSVPKFANEDEEARWWASVAGRRFVKAQAATRTARQQKGSSLASGLSRTGSVQIALRLPVPDLAKAREIAQRKGIGYQTLLKMLVHEGLRREAS